MIDNMFEDLNEDELAYRRERVDQNEQKSEQGLENKQQAAKRDEK